MMDLPVICIGGSGVTMICDMQEDLQIAMAVGKVVILDSIAIPTPPPIVMVRAIQCETYKTLR